MTAPLKANLRALRPQAPADGFWAGKRVVVTGGSGFLGTHVVARLRERGATDIFVPRSASLNLVDRGACHRAVQDADIVIHLAARVGGIGYNQENPGLLFFDNLMMGAQLMEEARLRGVEKFVAVGTVCAYPAWTTLPFREDDLWDGYPEPTNAPYGLAKKMLLVQAQAYRQQYGFNAIYLLPVNLYGPGDNFDPRSSHVIPALIRKIEEARQEKRPFIDVWGDGSAHREFLYVEDAATGIVQAAERYNGAEPVNLGSGKDISIKELVRVLCELLGYRGHVRWDTARPNGQMQRRLDVTRAFKEFGFMSTTDFSTGLRATIDWWLEQSEAGSPAEAIAGQAVGA